MDGPEQPRQSPRAEPGHHLLTSPDSVAATLLQEYRAFGGNLDAASLAARWLERLVELRSDLGSRDYQAVALRVAQHIEDMRLKPSIAPISEEEFLHAMMLLQAKDGRAAAQIHAPLKVALAQYPDMLRTWQGLFIQADSSAKGSLSVQDVTQMYKYDRWRLNPKSAGGQPLSDAELAEPEVLAAGLVKAMDTTGNGTVSYADFIAFCVGRRKYEVRLHKYDLAQKSVGDQLGVLLGKDLQQLWHTGIVVFDKEYYFAHDAIFDLPGLTGFGEPTEVMVLGHTLWNQAELHDFVCSDLKPVFHRGTYDIIQNNCNDFSNRMSLYLLGKELPEDILRQSERLMQLVSIRLARPILNYMLRDCVASRGQGTAATVMVPHGKLHCIATAEELVPGGVVAVHPSWGRGLAVLGVVSEPPSEQSLEDECEFTGRAMPGLLDLSCHGGFACLDGGISSLMLQQDEVYVKYLEETFHKGRISTTIRTRRMPIGRLSRVALDGPVGTEYRQVFNQFSLKFSQARHSVWESAMVPLSPREEDTILGSEKLISVDLSVQAKNDSNNIKL